MELLLIALGGCTGADVVSILEKKRQRVTAYEIEVRGERRAEHPRIYTSIEVVHRIRGHKVDPKAVAHAIELSETKYCSVSAMLAVAAKITTRLRNNRRRAIDSRASNVLACCHKEASSYGSTSYTERTSQDPTQSKARFASNSKAAG